MLNKIINVLSTRELNDSIIQNATFRGITIETAPFINTEPIEEEQTINKILEYANETRSVVFTSVNAVTSVSRHINIKPNWDIFSMGGVTRERAITNFGEKALIASAKNAILLAQKIVASQNIKEITFFCGDIHLDDLPEILKANGIKVNELVVYKTLHTPIKIIEDYDGIVFFSPSAVHSFFSENTLPISTVIFSIGKTTTSTIRTYVTNEVHTSEWPGKEQMIQQVIEYFIPK